MPLGTLKLPLYLGRYFEVEGGPYRERPLDTVGVKMAVEINLPCQVSIPTEDYKTPPIPALQVGLIKTVEYIVKGHPVYVGCMGGMGRTGLFLAILAKAWGITNPVEYVRKNYYAHAVETAEQYKFVMDFKVPEELAWQIALAKLKSVFRFGERNLTQFT